MDIFLEKALESLNGAESEFVNGRYNNCANRCYYACFQAAISALIEAGLGASHQQWKHGFVQAQFDGILINRRKKYPSELRGTLSLNSQLRESADYKLIRVTRDEAARGLNRTRRFVAAIKARVGKQK